MEKFGPIRQKVILLLRPSINYVVSKLACGLLWIILFLEVIWICKIGTTKFIFKFKKIRNFLAWVHRGIISYQISQPLLTSLLTLVLTYLLVYLAFIFCFKWHFCGFQSHWPDQHRLRLSNRQVNQILLCLLILISWTCTYLL